MRDDHRGRHAELKASQSSKISELRDALVATGFVTLGEQARTLGLARSTTWTILCASHKNSGLTAATINRMLRSPQMPALVRTRLLEYVGQKIAGHYGHSEPQRRKFAARLTIERMGNINRIRERSAVNVE
jgi:hypothetical protein